MTKHRAAMFAALILAAPLVRLHAQEPVSPGGMVDPPARVARLNWFNGNVSLQPATVDTWSPAALNYPLTTGDHIFSDSGSRAEIRTGPNAIRLNWETNFGFLNLDDRTVQARVTEGAIEIRLRQLDDDDTWEIDTPQGAVTLLRTGDYRIETDPARNAMMITVRSGTAQVTGNGINQTVRARQTGYFQEGFQGEVLDANPMDDFDYFVGDRNQRDDRMPAPTHVPETMVGYEDLDANGAWNETVDYGWVWRPRVEAGWVPYQYGHWAWVEPWGWTWIDNASWGFAPFHYGRWAVISGVWVWVPGSMVHRPVYAPALVVFAGGPGIGWFPLGPREPYYPGYRVSPGYIRQLNITHVTNINNISTTVYANQRVPGALSVVDREAFIRSRPVHSSLQGVRPGQYNGVIGYAAPVAPTRESITGPMTNRSVAAPSQRSMSRPVVVRSAPPAAPVEFGARQESLSRNPGRPLSTAEINDLRSRQPSAVLDRAPVRRPAPDSAPRPAMLPRQPAQQQDRPSTFERPAQRQPDSRPQEVRPQENQRPQMPVERAPRPDFNRTIPELQRTPAPEYRPVPVRPVPEARPVPENRPAPELRPTPRQEQRQIEPRPMPEARPGAPERGTRPLPRREEKREEKKVEDKKPA